MARALFIIALFVSVMGFPQSEIDILEKRLGSEKVDSSRVNILLDLFGEYRYENPAKAEQHVLNAIDIASGMEERKYQAMALNEYAGLLNDQAKNDSSISVYQKALAIAERIQYDTGKGIALIGLGNTYLSKGNIEKAEQYHKRNIAFASEIDDHEGVASSYNNLGNIYNEQGEYKKAMGSYTLAAKRNMEIGNEKNGAIAMANMGLIHQKINNYEDAIAYYTRSDSLFKKLDFLPGRAFVLKNLGVVYKNQGKLDDALEQYGHALESYGKMGLKRAIGQVHENMGNIFFEKEEFGNAITEYRKSLSIANETSDSISIAIASQALGAGFLRLKRWDSAQTYAKNAVDIAEATGIELTAMDGYMTLAEVYYGSSSYKSAYDYLLRHKTLRDSLYTIEKRDLAEEIEAEYQNEQKTKEIALLASEKELQALQLNKRENERNLIIAFALMALLLAGLLYNQYRIKQRSNRELQELDRLKSNFFANISHEFRTPLTLIKGPIEQLEQNPGESLSREDVKMIRRNSNRVLGLVDQLLDLSRIDQGKLRLKPTEGDVHKCLWTAVSSFNSHAAQRNMDFRVRIPDEPLWAAFDRDKFEKIIYNLLSNAFKFSDDGEVVSIEAHYVEGELNIQVGDSGRGIPEDRLPFIFDRFYQIDSGPTKEKEGSGIGLSLSKDLVDLMDGTITVSSEEGKGTFFTVQLPLHKIETGRKASLETSTSKGVKNRKEEPFVLSKADKRNLPQILLIEDNGDMRHFIKEQLVGEYRVNEAINGEEGYKKAISNLPDLIITDLMMPKMDGIELCKKLKNDFKTSHIPLIMLTARAGSENKIEGLETGADDYLTKPFHAKELSVRVKNLIALRTKLRERYDSKEVHIDPGSITATSLDRKFMEQVLELLEENHADAEFGVSQMQDKLAMSKTQLYRKIKALTDESPGGLIRNFRLRRAAQLLSQKADTVTQIAYRTGFHNLSYFAKCFKELYGVSPSSY